MIQFWTTGADAPSEDIVIRRNQLVAGRDLTQSIFMRNEMVDTGKAGPEMFYRNVAIEDNVIVNAHQWGIMLGETEGAKIADNRVLHSPLIREMNGKPTKAPLIKVAERSRNVVIERNIAGNFWGYKDQPDWTVAENVTL